jgi:hypothetical protein
MAILDFMVQVWARVVVTIRFLVTGQTFTDGGASSCRLSEGIDLRTPEEKKSDYKREIVNAKQLYSNGFLIETVSEESATEMGFGDIESYMSARDSPYQDTTRMTTVLEPTEGAIVLGPNW